ncbi:hypothetical protein M3212_03290 [Alkalihalobacillus oceani]|uniref:hypothetical protein n=1 Tax=Halalkalibacter oceani TaxID=1653776 RepID=UPI00203E60F0|nr:hypothetical protein [Halalkalibacter oceani]MCM3759809.1 hypothetical protein [Halalkalibacter oceani]
MKAVIDRMVDQTFVVLLVGSEEKEMIFPKEAFSFPVREGLHLEIELAGDQLLKAEKVDAPKKADPLERLRKRQHSRYKRNGR